MADTSTTDEKLEEQAPEEEQLGTEDEAADTQPDEPSTPESTDEAPEESEDSDDGQAETEELDSETLEWAEKKGLDTSNPTKILKSYREAEKALHRKGSEVSELRNKAVEQAKESADEYDSPEVLEQRALNAETRVNLFWTANPEAKRYEKEMAETLVKKPYLQNDLDALYAVVLKDNQHRDTHQAKRDGKREALESTAKAQRSTAAKSSATTKETSREVTEEDIKNMSQAEYNAWAQDNDPFAI